MKKLSLISICLFLLPISCQKEKLPKLTQEGKNTFGCKINGKNWVPQGGGSFSGLPPTGGGFFENTNTIYIRSYNDQESIEFYLRDVFHTGKYVLNFNTPDFTNTRYPQNYGLYSNTNNSYVTTSQYTGEVSITNRDTVNKIVSGIFEFTAVNSEGKTVKITDGRFDIKSH